MAKITENLLVKRARGNVAKQFVYRTRGNDTHIAKMPHIPKGLQPTQGQENQRSQFASAVLYAQGAISDPTLKDLYQKKAGPGKAAYNVAFRDFLKAPVVRKITTAQYTGVAGSAIVVAAKDDFRVAKVTVSIYAAGGALIEQGDAVLNPINREQWIYTATHANAALAGTKITATAFDLPGNTGTLDVTL